MTFLKKLEPLTLLLLRCGVALVFIYQWLPEAFRREGENQEFWGLLSLDHGPVKGGADD